jgi:hypothetical protein
VGVEYLAHLGYRARQHPRPKRRSDQLAGGEPPALVAQVDVHHLLDAGARFAQVGGRHQATPLAACQRDDHDATPVAGAEVTPEGAVQVVAVLDALVAVDLHLGDLAEVADHP